MGYLLVTIEQIQLPITGQVLTILIEKNGVGLPFFTETFVAERAGTAQSTAPGSEIDPFVVAEDFVEAWNLDYKDYGGANNAVASVFSPTQVQINFTDPTWQIVSVEGTAITGGYIIVDTLTNNPVEDPSTAQVTSYEAYPASPCSQAIANVAVTGGNNLYNVYLRPAMTLVHSAVASPFQLTDLRGSSSSYRITDSLGFLINDDFIVGMPKSLSSKKIDISVVNLSVGATVTITSTFISADIEPYNYSLDNVLWQASNVYTGLAPGSFTLYVRDAWLCVKQYPFVVDGVTTITETVFTISEINAVRFARIDDAKKNHKNTLSCFELKKLTYPFFHRYLSDDVFVTQFKTNAQYINVFAMDYTGTQTPINALKMTENIGIDAKSECTYFDYGEGQSAVSFGQVNILDPVTEAVLSTEDFGFTLPEWANTVGNYVTIAGVGQVPIDAIGYSDDYDTFVLIFDIVYTGVPITDKIISAIYNVQPYEVYEITADMSVLPELFSIIIEVGADVDNIDFQYISEKIKRVTDSDKLIEIYYSDDENKGDMVYQTEIVHKMLLEGAVDYRGDQETEGYNGDTDYFVTDNLVYDSQNFIFYRLSSEMAHKLRLVMTHLYLQINGLNYKISEIPKIKTDRNNNSKTFSITLKRGGEEFLTAEQEIITTGGEVSAKAEARAAAIAASQGKSLILWSK